MNIKKFGSIAFGFTALVIIGYIIFMYIDGQAIGFNEVIVASGVIMMFLSSLTWGNEHEDDGILPEEELGQKIIEKSAKISYYVLMVCIIVIIGVEQMLTGTTSIYMLIVLALAMLTMPFVELIVSKKYQ